MNQIQRDPYISETHAEIAAEWHPTKNIKTPDQVSNQSRDTFWWLCRGPLHHEWQATAATRCRSRARGSSAPGVGCPFCASEKINIPAHLLEKWDPGQTDTPLKTQLARFLGRLIVDGVFAEDPMGKMPAEKSVSEVFGMSRMTARAAIEELRNRNLVKRTQRGTFATKDHNEIESGLGWLGLPTLPTEDETIEDRYSGHYRGLDLNSSSFGRIDFENPEELIEDPAVPWSDQPVSDGPTSLDARPNGESEEVEVTEFPYPTILCVGAFGSEIFFDLMELLQDDFHEFDRSNSTLKIPELTPYTNDSTDQVGIKVLCIGEERQPTLTLESAKRDFHYIISRNAVMQTTIGELEDYLGGNDSVIVVGKLDGDRQKSLLGDILTRLQELEVFTVALLGLEDEDPALQTHIAKLVNKTDQCILVDIDTIATSQDPTASGQVFSKAILTLLSSALITNEFIERVKARRKQFINLLSDDAWWTFGLGEKSGENRIDLAIGQAREMLRMQGIKLGDVRNILVQFTGHRRMSGLQTALNKITDGLPQTTNIVFDIGPTDIGFDVGDDKETFRVVIFADQPTSEIEVG